MGGGVVMLLTMHVLYVAAAEYLNNKMQVNSVLLPFKRRGCKRVQSSTTWPQFHDMFSQ